MAIIDLCVGRDSSVGIATRYGLDGPGIESRCGARYSAPVQTNRGTHPASYKMGTGSFPGVKRPGLGVDHPPPSSADVKDRVQLYLYSPSGPSWSILGWSLTLPLPMELCIKLDGFYNRDMVCLLCGKGKAVPLQALRGPEGSRRLRLPDFMTIGTWRW
jgi:hypothetical protein